MTKYAPLGDFLRKQPKNEVRMTFSEIERVTGTKLPPSAQRHRAWWSNNPSNSVITQVWLDAGYLTERVDIKNRKLIFRRAPRATASAAARTAAASRTAAGSKVHPLFGALTGLIRIAPGTDLTQPADPDWGRDK